MPEGSRRGSSRSSSKAGAKRPSSVSSLSGIVGRMTSSGERAASSASVNTVGERPASLSLSSSTSSVSLQDASSSSSSSSSLPCGTYKAAAAAAPQRNGSDISLDLTPLVAAGRRAPRQLSRLERVVMEIVETEQAYVRDLKSIVEDYLGCIIDCGALPVNPEQVSGLFCNIEDIYEFNSELLEDLERSQHAADIADCFVERSEAFDIYTLYCMNYPNSVSVLRECMRNESLVRFFHQRQTSLNHSLPLETYLLKPVQRILKYHLLLQELSKHLDKSDPGYRVVEDAIITMTAVAWYINDMKRKQEHAVRLQEIEALLVNWSGPDLSGFGELVLEGSFKVHRVKKERAFFLFDKMLLIAKKRAERFVYSTHIFCCNLLLVDAPKEPLCFRVADLMIPKQQHVVQTKNTEEKRLWVHYLKKLVVENHPASLPHKARQVLGDICQSAQFEQDHLKKFSSASPRLDDIHAYHRGRRQSEPPEWLTYTPEKSRKSLPLLLEGNLPYRRTRRQSAPAKDIEAAFHPHSLKQADCEGELNRVGSLSSAGSSGTLASSVIQRESEQKRKQEQEEEEDDEEDLAALCAPPTLSITEEILELINQSQSREGLVSVDQVLDQPTESQPPPYESNFTCPLPPLASSPEETLTLDPQQEDVETYQNRAAEEQTAGCQNGLERANMVRERVENGPRAEQEAPEEELQRKVDIQRKISEGGEREKTLAMPTLLFPPTEIPPSISVMEDSQASSHLLQEEAPNSSTNPDDSHGDSPSDQPKQGSALTRRDMRIIEKIRSYYEAAAELEEDRQVEDVQEEDEMSRKRNSFSQIPTGLVRDSVSHFTSDNQEECKNEPVETEPGHNVELTSSAGPASVRPEDSHDHDGHADTPIRLMDLEAKDINLPDKSPIFTQMEDENPNEVLVKLLSISIEPSEVEKETGGGNGNVSNKQSEEDRNEGAENSQQDETPGQEEGPFTEKNDTSKSVPPELARTNESECNLNESKEEKESLKESSGTLSNTPQCHKTATWTRNKNKVTKSSRNPEELPRQIKLGRGSRQSRIVSTKRALFEGMVSDITGIGLFEAGPAADPSLLENSERILSKVQTLASMYSAKASTMKVPLHQKRAIFVRNKTGGLTGLSLISSQTLCHSQPKSRLQVRKQPKCDIASHAPAKLSDSPIDAKPGPKSVEQTDTKNEFAKFSQAKAQSNSLTQTKNKFHVPAKAQMSCERQNHTNTNCKNQNHTMSQEDISLGERLVKERIDVVKTALPGEEPIPTCQLQSHGSTLSRPRDFITALSKEQSCGRLDDKRQSTVTPEEMSTAVRRTSSSSLSQDKSNTLRSELREHVYTEETASVNSIVKHLGLSSHRPHWNASNDEDGHYQYKQDLPAVQYKHDPQSQIPAKDHETTSEPSKEMRSVRSEDLMCRHVGSGPGEMGTLSSATNLTSSQHQALLVQKPKQPPEGLPKEAFYLMGGSEPALGVSRGSSKEDLLTINKTKCEFNSYSQPTWTSLPKVPGPTFQRQQPEGPSPLSSMQVLESNVRPTLESHDCLPEFTSQKPSDVQTMLNKGKVNFSTSCEYRKPDQQGPVRPTSLPIFGAASGCCSPPRAVLGVFCQAETSTDTHFSTLPPVFRHSSPSSTSVSPPSPNPTMSSFSCSSPIRVSPLPSPTAVAHEGFFSPDLMSRTQPCFAAPPSSVRSLSKRTPPASCPTHNHTSSKGAGPSSPGPPSSLCPPPRSSSVASPSTFTRSLAASCISQTLAKKNNARHQVQSSSTQSPSCTPSSHLRRCSPSARLPHSQEVTSPPADSHLGATIDRKPRCPPSPLRSTCPSPITAHSTFYSNSQNSSYSPFIRESDHQPLSSASCTHRHHSVRHKSDLPQNAHNTTNLCLPTSSNCALSCSPSPPRVRLVNVGTSLAAVQQTGDRLSYNCIARPFSASEPNSRVQSPSPVVSPASFTRLCSPPPQLNSASAMASKPPHPRCSRAGGASSHNPLGLTLKIPEASAASLPTGPASSRVCPQILSPPAICVSLWICNATAPPPRNPQLISPSHSISSCSGQTAFENATFSSPPSVLLHSSRAGSPHGHPNKAHTLQRSLSNVSDTSQIPVQSQPGQARCSWSESSQRSLGFTDGFDKQVFGLTGPRNGRSSYGGSPSCLSPRGGLESPISPRRFARARSDIAREHFSSDPWLDGQLLCNNFNGREGFVTSCTSTAIGSPSPQASLSQSVHSSMAADWGDPELEQGSCRSQLICAYVGRPPPELNFAAPCVARSPPAAAQHRICQARLQSPPRATHTAASASPPASFACSPPSKVSNQKTSYATTVNLQIAGGGRITSFSSAHVSVSQTPPGGPGCGETHSVRRVSVNGLSQVSSPLPKNCGQL